MADAEEDAASLSDYDWDDDSDDSDDSDEEPTGDTLQVAASTTTSDPRAPSPSRSEDVERLHALVRSGDHSGVLETLKSEEVHVDAVDPTRGQTALHHAANSVGNNEVLASLLELGADVEVADWAGDTALHKAAKRGNAPASSALLFKGADVNGRNAQGETPLHHAAAGSFDAVKVLLEHAPDVNAQDAEHWTPLHLAVQAGRLDTTKALIEAGADVNLPGDRGQTPLHLAIACGMHPRETLQVLLAANAEVDQVDEQGYTPLHRAAKAGDATLVQVLLEAGADPSVTCPTGQDALQLAVAVKAEAVVKVLGGEE